MKKLLVVLVLLWLLGIGITQSNIIEAERENAYTIHEIGTQIDNLTIDVSDLKRESKEHRRVEPKRIEPVQPTEAQPLEFKPIDFSIQKTDLQSWCDAWGNADWAKPDYCVLNYI